MRLLNTKTLQIEQFTNHGGYNTLLKKGADLIGKRATPRYAILSHTWGEGEVIFQDMDSKNRPAAMRKRGWRKLEDSCRRAAKDGFQYIWIDTCCIDKTSSTELAEAINSMFQWYKESDLCYAFLEDCQGPLPYRTGSSSSPLPRWYSRGWTLQELIAPKVVHFYSMAWKFLGTKDDHALEISRLTGIDTYSLGGGDLSRISVARRMSWVATRQTTRMEDMAYSVMGIFNISMPLLYGEGAKAFARLQKEIMKGTDDQSLFAWSENDSAGYRNAEEKNGLLAYSPLSFASAASVTRFYTPRPGHRENSIESQGSVINLLMCHDTSSRSNDVFFAILDCQIGHVPGVLAGIRLMRKGSSGNDFMRVDTSQIFQFARFEKDGSIAVEGFDPTKEQTQLVEVRSRAVFRNWAPRTIRVLQSSPPQLPPGFWLVPPQNISSAAISVQTAYPVKHWDAHTWLMQPPSADAMTPKVGAVQLKFNGKLYSLIFGVVNTREGVKPWCALEESSGRVSLEQWFTQFKAQVDKPNGGAKRSPNIDVTVRLAKVSGHDMYIMQLLTR
ncbi:hypothetical protein TsFJ059_008789 [Trichoderma semiorbis]|uniref:Heterokaryon incompatibility domain-containing protein n=1 Tax=Trichoderma semiorbis TaxID=1491008 RepID=A0A9P8KPD3_9HYPO|nr:hypothetical protein TsFJ059_008789 [Trichoderma semiorbis]